MKTLLEQWIDYRKILPADAPTAQIIETRRAFYAGAHAILSMQWDMSCDATVSDDAGAQRIESWHQECRDFQRVVGTVAEQHFP